MPPETVAINVPANDSTVSQRNELLEKMKRAAPPGYQINSLDIARQPNGSLSGTLVREARIE